MSFWFTIVYLITVWSLALYVEVGTRETWSFQIAVSTVFFALYFALPLFSRYLHLLHSVLLILPLLITGLFYQAPFNGFGLLIGFVVAKETLERVEGAVVYGHLSYQFSLLMVTLFLQYNTWLMIYSIALILFVGFLLLMWHLQLSSNKSLHDDYNHLLHRYKQVKQHISDTGEKARLNERHQIARELHDSVGHRLTALLMQLEVARLNEQDQSSKETYKELKALAQKSLDETREAVQTLKTDHVEGLSAIIQLIRKLEAESHLRIAFYMQPGVFKQSLTNDQSVAIYRATQEALTNMMRHSDVKDAVIEFGLVGDHYFRFQIRHDTYKETQIEEGFGIRSMKERLKMIKGSLVVEQKDQTIHVIGTFPLKRGESK
ncbi:sensor histidine kinase [Pelagirhabdus alkalitolerans]|uniref:sensor histidine kinase n=1 Tax=Pelagirhabdus alkalitolerans TaxID=1612202 RepID=UPI00115FC6E9|nr:sensor histidine kinase [Pelagirhabdus alkalitolerans]